MDLKVNIEKKQEGCYAVSLIGSLDSTTYTEFENKLNPILESSPKVLVLDMQGLSYISSIGFGIIFRAKQALEKSGGNLAIANLQPNVKRIFEAVKIIPESLFVTIKGADEYLDSYIAHIDKDAKDAAKKNDGKKNA